MTDRHTQLSLQLLVLPQFFDEDFEEWLVLQDLAEISDQKMQTDQIKIKLIIGQPPNTAAPKTAVKECDEISPEVQPTPLSPAVESDDLCSTSAVSSSELGSSIGAGLSRLKAVDELTTTEALALKSKLAQVFRHCLK
eukprot:SAG31_NODE_220_length_19925_cov_3.630939_8_plen_138_part_00